MATKKDMEEVYGKAPVLDLSKIKNVKAAKETGTDVTKFVPEDTFKKRKSKFSFTEEHLIPLPTKGYLYQDAEDEDIRKGFVKLRPMSIADEEIISNQSYIKSGSVFVNLLNSCMTSNFDARDFVPYDVFYLIYTLRQITYGTDYTFNIECEECEKKYEYEMNMNEVEFEEIENSEESPRKQFRLPVSKYIVDMRCTKLGDEEQIYRNSRNSKYGETILGFVARTYNILDDENKEVDKKDFPEFFMALPGTDRAEITRQFKGIEGLSIPTVRCVCPNCGHEEEKTIPFSKGFFRY